MRAVVLSVCKVAGGEAEKYSACFSIRKSRLLSKNLLNSDRFSYSAISFIGG